MADDLTTQSATLATIPASSVIATDDVSGKHYQRVKITDGTADSTNHMAVDSGGRLTVKLSDGSDTLAINADGSINISGTVIAGIDVERIQVTPTISSSPAYSLKDAIGGLLTFANAAATSGGSCRIESVTVVDKGQQKADIDLVLFKATFTAPTDNAVFDPTDTELLDCVGVIPILGGDYSDFNDNAIASPPPIGRVLSLTGTSLFGALVARSTPTYTSTSDIVVTLEVTRF